MPFGAVYALSPPGSTCERATQAQLLAAVNGSC